jgi:hypothetical protein
MTAVRTSRDHVLETVPRTVRWFVRVFLVAFVVCAVAGVEAWPFTGFRLFSRPRHETETTWAAYTVADGRQTRLWFGVLPRPYQGFELIMSEFRHLAPPGRRALCEAWLAEARRVRRGVGAIRIYRLRVDALPRHGDRPGAPTSRSLVDACS